MLEEVLLYDLAQFREALNCGFDVGSEHDLDGVAFRVDGRLRVRDSPLCFR